MIEGGIDSVIVSQLGNETVAAKVEQLDQAWSERRGSIAPGEFDKELRAEWRERGRFAESQALLVVAGYIELLESAPREIEEAREKSRQNGFQSRQRRVAASAPTAPGAVVVEEQEAPAAVEQQAPHAAQEQEAPAVEQQALLPVVVPVPPHRKMPRWHRLATWRAPSGVDRNGNGHLVEK